ncbi:MAG TPA: hypothetical protein VIU40_01250 [Geobacteraceae bacterium]
MNQPPSFSCSSPNLTCAATFSVGTPFTLRATPAQLYSFSGWSGGGCSGTADCSLALSADTTLTATFTPLPLVEIVGSGTPYLTFAAALADADRNVTIKARNVPFGEDLTLSQTLDIALFGGFREDFVTADGYTELRGTLTLSLGSLTVDNLAIR